MVKILLTIDDAPSGHMGEKLKFLNKHNITAIWFCIGKNIITNRAPLLEAINTGHLIANHSYTHPSFSNITFETVQSEVLETEKLIDELYETAGQKRPAKFFRFPYGNQGDCIEGQPSTEPRALTNKARLRQFLLGIDFQPGPFANAQYSYQYVANQPDDPYWGWSYDIQEWGIHRGDKQYAISPEKVVSNLNTYMNTYDTAKDQIILLHDHPETSELFPELITQMLDKGTVFSSPETII